MYYIIIDGKLFFSAKQIKEEDIKTENPPSLLNNVFFSCAYG
jgi:hypothetical protein